MKPCPINPSWIEAGAPEARIATLAQSDDRAASTILWECTPGQFTWRYAFDETIYFLEGEVTIRTAGHPTRRLTAGDTLHFARGAVATWNVERTVRKLAFCRSALPRPMSYGMRVLRGVARRTRALLLQSDDAPSFREV